MGTTRVIVSGVTVSALVGALVVVPGSGWRTAEAVEPERFVPQSQELRGGGAAPPVADGASAAERVAEVGYDDGTEVAYAYDGRGNRTVQSDVSGTIETVYDADSRIVEESMPGPRGTMSYVYDPVGNLVEMTDPTGTTGYGYNAVNLVTEIVEPDGSTTQMVYEDNTNLLAQRILPTAPVTVEAYEYDDDGQVVDILATIDGQQVSRFGYGYDGGLRSSVDYDGSDGSWSYTYAYDAADRLVDATSSERDDHSFGYDAASNRTQERHIPTDGSATTTWYGYDASNQRCFEQVGGSDPGGGCDGHESGATTFAYDGAGNLTGSSDGLALGYNAAGQTVEFTTPDGPSLDASYAGEGQGQRVGAGDGVFASSVLGVTGQSSAGERTAWVRDPTGQLVGQRDDDGERVYYLTDALGSITGVVDTDGQVVNRYVYTPDGEDTETCPTGDCVDNPWRFAGEHLDEVTGMYKIGERYYQPDQAVWTQPDPLEGRINPSQPGEANPYAYAGCNPINYTDSTGLAVDQVIEVASTIGGLLFDCLIGGRAALPISVFAGAIAGPGAALSVIGIGCVGFAGYNVLLNRLAEET